ncbi:hypothetical protein Tco_0095133, partial [Tanacetum coccineum]
IPPPVERRDDLPETELPPHKRLCLSTLGSRYEIGESSIARPIGGRGVDYGFVSTVDAEARRQGISEVGYGLRDTWVDPERQFLRMIGLVYHNEWLWTHSGLTYLMGDRMTLQETVWMVEEESLCFPRGLGSLDRIESGDSSRASDPS